MDARPDDLVLKLIAFKRGWASEATWAEAEAIATRERRPLLEVLAGTGRIAEADAHALTTAEKRQAYLKRMVETEARFWEAPPKRLGRCDLEGPAARGGRAVIFKGVREHRPVAVKVLDHKYAFDLEEVERFRRQGDFGILLDHPNLVKVFELGWDEAVPYLVMQWVEGHPLSHALEENGPMPLELLMEAVVQSSRGMAHAHAKGVLHKDLKPDNILVDRVGHAVVSDFGIAVRMDEARERDAIVGTPAYMSPEQASGGRLDARSDIFSLGATLYECLTRQQPYQGENRRETAARAAAGRFLPPHKLNPDVPAALEAIVLKAMARRPGDRFQTMDVFGDALARWIGGDRSVPTAKGGWLGRLLGR